MGRISDERCQQIYGKKKAQHIVLLGLKSGTAFDSTPDGDTKEKQTNHCRKHRRAWGIWLSGRDGQEGFGGKAVEKTLMVFSLTSVSHPVLYMLTLSPSWKNTVSFSEWGHVTQRRTWAQNLRNIKLTQESKGGRLGEEGPHTGADSVNWVL